MRRDKVINDVLEQVRKVTIERERVKGSGSQRPCHLKLDVNLIDIGHSFSYDYEDRGIRGRRHQRDGLSNLKIETLKFDGNLKPEHYLNWFLAIERIFELKEHNNENFKLAIIKMKRYASLSYENLKKKRAREPSLKSRLGPSSRSIWTRGSYPPHTGKNSTSKSHLVAKRVLR